MSININTVAQHTMSSEALHNLVQLQGLCPPTLTVSVEYQPGQQHYLVTINGDSYYSRGSGFEVVDMLEPLIDLARGGQ